MDEIALAEYTTNDALTQISFKLVMFVKVDSNVEIICFLSDTSVFSF